MQPRENFEINNDFLQSIYSEYERLYSIPKETIEYLVRVSLGNIYNSPAPATFKKNNQILIVDQNSKSMYYETKLVIISDKKKKQFKVEFQKQIDTYSKKMVDDFLRDKIDKTQKTLLAKPLKVDDDTLYLQMYDSKRNKIKNLIGYCKLENLLPREYSDKDDTLLLFKVFNFYETTKKGNNFHVEVANRDTKILSLYANITLKKLKASSNVSVAYSHMKFDKEHNRAILFVKRKISKASTIYIRSRVKKYTGIDLLCITEKKLKGQGKR